MSPKTFQPFSVVLDATPDNLPKREDGKTNYGALVNAALAAFDHIVAFEYAIRNGEGRFLVTVAIEKNQTQADIEAQRKAFFESLGATHEPTHAEHKSRRILDLMRELRGVKNKTEPQDQDQAQPHQ